MFKLVSDLQKKPDEYKRKVTLLVSIGFTLIIIAVWLTTLFSGNSPVEEDNLSVEDVSSPIESLRSSLASTMDSLKGAFKDLKEELEFTE